MPKLLEEDKLMAHIVSLLYNSGGYLGREGVVAFVAQRLCFLNRYVNRTSFKDFELVQWSVSESKGAKSFRPWTTNQHYKESTEK